MFRGLMPHFTILTFGIGLGLGFSWSHGWIPLTLTSAKSGALSIEVAQREALPRPNEDSRSAGRNKKVPVADDPEIFEQQTEPEATESAIRVAQVADDRALSSEARAIPESGPVSPQPSARSASRESDLPLVPLRNRNPVVLEENVKRPAPIQRRKPIVAVAHEDLDETDQAASKPFREDRTSSKSLREQLADAQDKLAAGDTLAAHRDLSKLYWNHKEFRPQIQETIDSISKTVFFQNQPHFIEPYVIQSGDRLEVIAKKYQMSWEYLAKLNRTDPKRIQIGQKLKVVKGPFAATVDLRDFTLTVHLQSYYVKQYSVGIGKEGSSPVGKFTVLNKVENPPYTGPDGKVIAANDPSNPLGERWIDLGDSYGIHGTIDPNSIGKAESRGCIRMRDKDIIEVYNFLVKGSEVTLK